MKTEYKISKRKTRKNIKNKIKISGGDDELPPPPPLPEYTIDFNSDISKQDLTNKRISQDLKRKNLNNLIFNGSILIGSNLEYAKLKNTKFIKSNLSGVNFKDAELTDSDLTDADLHKANMNDTSLENANFSNTNCTGAKFIGAFSNYTNFSNSDLTGADMAYIRGYNINFLGAIFSNTRLFEATLVESNFSGLDLSGANFSDTDLTGSNFTGCDLRNVNFSNAILIRAIFTNARTDGLIYDNADFTDIIGYDDDYTVPVVDDAYQVHKETNKITKGDTKNFITNKLFPAIDSSMKEIPDKKDDAFYVSQPKITDYILPKLITYVNSNFEENKKNELVTKLTSIFNKFENTTEISKNKFNKLIVGKCIDFVLSQPKEFIDNYIEYYVQDTFGAYEGTEDTMSCTAGILERIYLTLGDVAFTLCPEDCDNDTYKQLAKIFKKKKYDISDFAKEWNAKFLDGEPADKKVLEDMNKEGRKQHFIHFVKKRFQDEDAVDETLDAKINKYANDLDSINVFEKLDFSGGKKFRVYTKMRFSTRKTQQKKNKNSSNNKRMRKSMKK